jgi:hypothetical protein
MLQPGFAAAAWIAEQRSQPWYDSTAAGLATAVHAHDAATANEWLNTIQNEKIRAQIVQQFEKTAAGKR